MTEPVRSEVEFLEPGLFEREFRVHGTARAIFDALLEPDLLRTWFTEHAEVEPRVGGKFHFHGRFTPFTSAGDRPQVITRLERDARLHFEWHWSGGATAVEIELRAPGTLRVRHDVRRAGIGRDARESGWLAHDFWSLSVGNLNHFLRTGRAALRPDHSRPAADAELSIDIDAPPEDVWRALTDPAELRAWMGATAPAVDLRVGGEYTYGWIIDGRPCGPLEILELEPRRRLVVRWSHEGDATNRTAWTLTALDTQRTRVTLRQIGTKSHYEFHGYLNGWGKFLLDLHGHLRAAPSARGGSR